LIRVADIANGAIKLMAWTGAILALQDRNQALRSQVVFDEVINLCSTV